MSSSIENASNKLQGIDTNQINQSANLNTLNQSSQQAQDILNVLESIKSETQSLRGMQQEFDGLLDSLDNVSGRIQNVIEDINKLNSTPLSNNIVADTVKMLEQAVTDAGDSIQKLSSNIGSTSAFENFSRAAQEISTTLQTLNKDLHMVDSNVNTVFTNMRNTTSQAADEVKKNVDDINKKTSEIGKADVPMDTSFSFLVKALESDFNKMKKVFEDNNSSLEQQFQTLRNIGGSAASAAFEHMPKMAQEMKLVVEDSVKQLHQLFELEFNNMQKDPERIAKEFNSFAEGLMNGLGQSQETLINSVLQNLPSNTFDKLTSEVLQDVKGVYGNFANEYKSVIDFGNNVIKDLEAQATKGVEGANDAANKIKEQIEKLNSHTNNMSSQLTHKSANLFANELKESLISDSAINKRYNDDFVHDKLDQFKFLSNMTSNTSRITSSVHNLQDRLNYDDSVNFTTYKSVSSGVNTDKILKDAEEIDKLMKVFNKNKSEVVKDISEAHASQDKKRIEAAKNQLEELIDFSKQVNSRMMGIAGSINVNSSDIKNVSELRELINNLQAGLKTSKTHFRELYDVAKLFGMDPKALSDIEKMNSELTNTQNTFNKLNDSSKSLWQNIKSGITDFLTPLSMASKAMGVLGVSGLPAGISGLKQYWSGSSDYYKKQAEWREQAIQSELGLGNTVDLTGAQYRVYNQGMKYQELSRGMINFQDYNNSYINLVKNVGGQNGASDSQTIQDLNKINDNTFAAAKVYGIQDSTMADYVKTFYRDLRQSSDEVSYSFNKIAQSATTANVPVEQYMKTVTQLAAQYRGLGLTGNDAMTIMDKFTGSGLGVQDAQAAAQSVGQGISNFAKNDSQVIFGAMMSGQTTDMFKAMRMARSKYDANGNPSDEWANSIAKSIDYNTSMYGGIGGGNTNAAWDFAYNYLQKTVGISDEKALQKLADSYTSGNNEVFQGLLKETVTKSETEKKTVVLEGRESMENALKGLGEQLTAAHEWQAALARGQYTLADTTAGLRNDLLHKLYPALDGLINTSNNIITTLTKWGTNIADSKIGGGLLSAAAEHPFLALGTAYLGSKAIGGGTKLAGQGIKKGASTIWGKLTGSGTKAATEAASEVAETAASKTPSLLSKLLKSRSTKVAGAAAAVTGIGYLLNKLGDDDEKTSTTKTLNDRLNANYYIPGNDKLTDTIVDIKSLLSDKFAKDASISGMSGYTVTNPQSFYGNTQQQNSTATTVVETVDKNPVTIPGILTPDAKTQGLISASEYNGLSNPEKAGQFATDVGLGIVLNKAISKIGTKAATDVVEKASVEAGEKLLTQAGGKTLLKSVLSSTGTALIGDAAVNYWDPAKRAINGTGMAEDWGKGTAGFAMDASWTLGGAAIGTLITPGAGTVAGALIGSLAGIVTDLVTADKEGKGVVTKGKDWLTEQFTGYSSDEIELKRMMHDGGIGKFITQQVQGFGFNESTSTKMVEVLEKNADKLSKFTNEDKFNYALLFATMKEASPNASDSEIAAELDEKFAVGNENVKSEVINQLNGAIEKQTGRTSSEIAKTKNDIIKSIDNIQALQSSYKEGYNTTYDEGVKQNAEKLNISVESYKKALANENSPLHASVKKMDDNLRKKSDKEGSKGFKEITTQLREANAESEEITKRTNNKVLSYTSDYNNLATEATRTGKSDLASIFNIKKDIQSKFLAGQSDDMKDYILGNPIDEMTSKRLDAAGAISVRDQYEKLMGNAYSIQAAEDVFKEKFGNDKGEEFFKKYKAQMSGDTKVKPYHSMTDKEKKAESEYADALKSVKNEIDARTNNIITQETQFKDEFTSRLQDTIKTGNTDVLRELSRSSNISENQKTLLEKINNGIQELQSKGFVAGKSTDLYQPSQSAQDQWGSYYDKTINPEGYEKYQQAKKKIEEMARAGVRGEDIVSSSEYKYTQEYNQSRRAFVEDPNDPRKKVESNTATIEIDPEASKFGKISAMMESGGKIGVSNPDGGSKSFGKYQFNAEYGLYGLMENIKAADPTGYKNYFKDAGGYESESFAKAFESYANKNPQTMEAIQDMTAKQNYYDVSAKYMSSKGFDLSNHSDALNNTVWQLAINLGTGGFGTTFDKIKNPNALNDQEIITQLYDNAKLQKPINNTWYENSKTLAFKMLNGDQLNKPAGTTAGNNANIGEDDTLKKLTGFSMTDLKNTNNKMNTPFAKGTLMHGILPDDFNYSSYMSGDSNARVNHLQMAKDLYDKAGGSQESFSINSQAISKALRQSTDETRKKAAEDAGRIYYDQFTADVETSNSPSIYKTDSIYKSSVDNLSSVAGSTDSKGQAVIGINVVNPNQPVDAKVLVEKIQQVFSEMGVQADIQRMDGRIDALVSGLDKTIDYSNKQNAKNY